MFPRRFVVVAVAALLILGLVMGIGSAQRQAWLEGYMMGRLSTGSDGGSSVAPLLPYAYPGYGGPHFGGFGALFGIGLLFLLVFGLFRCFAGRHFGGPWGGPSGPEGERRQRYGRHAPWWDWDETPEPRGEGTPGGPTAGEGGQA